MAIDFYFMHESPPCRAVQMVAAHLSIPLNLKYLDLSKGEHYAEEFTKLNPQRVVPTIVDNGFVLWESRAIITYLVNKYAPDSTLYPKEATTRAKVDQLLYFDIGTLYKAEGQYLLPILSSKTLEPEKEVPFKEALVLLDKSLSGNQFVCGNHLTVADISLLASLSFAEAAEYDFTSGFPKIKEWLHRLKAELPYYAQVNDEPMNRFTGYLRMKKLAAEAPVPSQ